MVSAQGHHTTAGLIYFANWTTGQNFSLTLVPPPGATFNGVSAEWIMEAPNGGEPGTALPSFTAVQFTDAFACTASQVTGDPQNGDTWNIVNNAVNPAQTLTSVAVNSGSVTIRLKSTGCGPANTERVLCP